VKAYGLFNGRDGVIGDLVRQGFSFAEIKAQQWLGRRNVGCFYSTEM
jgi:hypothetical protein